MPRQEPFSESASRLGRFSQTATSKGDPIKNIQNFAKAEQERKRKEEEEKKKKAAQINTAPQKGFLQRMIDKYYYGKKEE